MSASRRDLKRNGWRGYVLEGLHGKVFIDRESPRFWLVRRDGMPRVPGGFFAMAFKRLKDARPVAEQQAGAIPHWLDRRGKK